jgi:hypothetical protein
MRQNSTTYPTIRWRISGVVHEQEVGNGDNRSITQSTILLTSITRGG